MEILLLLAVVFISIIIWILWLIFRLIFRKEPKVDTGTIRDRYLMEHKILPELILGDDGSHVINLILRDKEKFFVGMYCCLHAEQNDKDYMCPYSPENFQVESFSLGNNTFMIKVKMPEPEKSPLCTMIAIIHDNLMDSRRYLTVEKSFEGEDMLCEWENMTHMNYGAYSERKLIKIALARE